MEATEQLKLIFKTLHLNHLLENGEFKAIEYAVYLIQQPDFCRERKGYSLGYSFVWFNNRPFSPRLREVCDQIKRSLQKGTYDPVSVLNLPSKIGNQLSRFKNLHKGAIIELLALPDKHESLEEWYQALAIVHFVNRWWSQDEASQYFEDNPLPLRSQATDRLVDQKLLPIEDVIYRP